MVKVSRYRLVTRPFIVIFLKTRGKPAALKVSRSIAHKLDDFWVQIRGAPRHTHFGNSGLISN